MDLFAWIGEDEFGSGEVGLKQYLSTHSALVSVDRQKIDNTNYRSALQQQADAYGKPIRLVRFVLVEELLQITPRPQG